MIFYATVVTVYSLLFVVLMVQFPSANVSIDKMLKPPEMPLKMWVSVVMILAFSLTAGLVIPLAVLAGFLSNTTWWRVLAFIATTIQVFVAGGSCLLVGLTLTHDLDV
jgi:hypothetical protein